jgi:hypothetical protein
MRPGPKGNSPQEQAAKNVNPSGRCATTVVSLFTDDVPDPDVIPPSSWLSDDAKDIWNVKVGRYRRRGQKIDGFQGALA